MATKTESHSCALFKLDRAPSNKVTLTFDDEPISAPEGVSLAAALLLNGVSPFRTTPVTSAPRAAYCMMGVCFECLVEIDGKPSCQACQITVREGMNVRRQLGASALELTAEGEGHGQ
ncbi:TPA: (2Fe-2S)-binding protein [Pseudomonas putida]|jgi:predicted molibdopterin-dependent oxidoreductase YjgC|uniref:(2Fe-2S)-binding protein n=1 Tax=Pseudomonas putida TaxID=303 RepID=UPI0023638457|nr:(2Fe-2S)-binding protein [Pseudomonas putida]MDD2008324.1 (2Fe-2S)-binding protein [Pseudomonas putida]HDS1775789.1 (2Fe-2S)-binding protein [Pseudomonas putida]